MEMKDNKGFTSYTLTQNLFQKKTRRLKTSVKVNRSDTFLYLQCPWIENCRMHFSITMPSMQICYWKEN